MNKDEILARCRAENQGRDEYEMQVLEQAGKRAAQVGMLACCFVAVASVIAAGRLNCGCWAIYFSIHATLFWTKYRRLHRRHELGLAVISTAAGLLFVGVFAAVELMGL